MPEFFFHQWQKPENTGSLGNGRTPDPEKHELYQDSRDKWQAVYQDQLGLVDHGLTTSLWKKRTGYSFIDSHIMMTVAVF